MTCLELQTYLGELLAMDLDNFKGESPTATQLVAQLNSGLRWVSRFINLFNPKVTFTPVAGQATQNIQDTSTPVVSQKVIRAYSVMMNGVKLYGPDGRNVGVWPYGQFIQDYPAWELATDGTVYRAVMMGEGKLLLNPAPTSAVVLAAQNFIAGTVYATPLVRSTEGDALEPDIPVDLHEAIAMITAAWAADPQIAADEALQRVRRYDARAYQALQDTRITNMNACSMFALSAVDDRDYMEVG